ncbi:hypothetical protein ACWD4F_23060 [Streptomyces aureus]
MSVELSTQAQFDGFTDDVARKLGTHCRTAPGYTHMPSRDIVDDEERALSLRQHDPAQPNRLRAYAALPDDSEIQTPSIGVTASSTRHVAREITRRLYPLHAEAPRLAAERTAQAQAEARDRRAVSEAVAGALPGACIEESHRSARVTWQRPGPQHGHDGSHRVDSVCVIIGASGERTSVEVSGRPKQIVAMLAAFAAASAG